MVMGGARSDMHASLRVDMWFFPALDLQTLLKPPHLFLDYRTCQPHKGKVSERIISLLENSFVYRRSTGFNEYVPLGPLREI